MLDHMKSFLDVALYVREGGGYAPIMRALKHLNQRDLDLARTALAVLQ